MHALSTEDSHGHNIAIGREALYAQDAGADAYNVAIGDLAGKSVTTGTNNTIIGGNAGDALTIGSWNVAVGKDALGATDESSYNVAVGGQSMLTNVDGSRNVALGYGSLQNMNPLAATDTYNIGIGL